MGSVDEAYGRYGPALVRKAERILGNRADAGDVVQSLFVELLQKGMAEVELPYLYRAVTNRCLNQVRDRSNRARLLERQDPALRAPARTRLDEAVVGLDLLVKLAGRLDDGHLEVLVYRYLDDMGQEEMAEVLGISRKTVGKRLQRIREAAAGLAGEARAT